MSDAGGERPAEPVVRLPAELMFSAFACVVILTAVVWSVLVFIGLLGWDAALAGMLGALASFVVGGAGLLLMKPWKPRSTGDLALLWLGSTVVRVLLTPLLALVLYFAAHPPIYPFVLGAGTAYLALLVLETALVAGHLRNQFD